MRTLLALLLLSTSAHAGPYVELGIGAKFGECDCSRLENPIGIVAVGYEWKNGFRFDVEHRSSLVEKDYGSNLATIRYRYEFKK
jgi:hypothetical protein